MKQEFFNQSMSQETLGKNLIAALTTLQHTAFDTEFLNDKNTLVEELPPESFLGFIIGDYHFIVQAKCFCEVFVDIPVAALPNAPKCLAGLSNIRGVLMPIYQLHSSLTLALPKKVTIFCIGKGDSAIGILIDGLPVSLSLSAHQGRTQINCSETLLKPLIKATYISNQTEWFLVNGHVFAEQLQAIANQTHKISTPLKNTYDLLHP